MPTAGIHAAAAAEAIREERERIIEIWFRELAQRVPDVTMWSDLTDHIPDLLEHLAAAVERGKKPSELDKLPKSHVSARLSVPNYDIAMLRREHMCLRNAILFVLRERDPDLPSDIVETVTAILDESAFRSAEHLVTHLLERAVRESRIREEFMAILAHDLRNPLQVILSVSDRLRRRLTDDRSRHEIDLLRQAADSTLGMARNLLELGRAEGGHVCVSESTSDADEALARVARVARERALAKRQEVTVSNDARGLRIAIDVDCIDRALTNLVENAIKFTPEGGEVGISFGREEGFGVFSVADNGPGIPETDIPFIFETFWRGSKRGTAGTGLGLAIVKGIAKAHEGTVSVEAAPGGGSVFRIRIPLAE